MVSDETIRTIGTDLDGFEAAGGEFDTKAVPQFAAALGISPEQLRLVIARDYPDVARGVAALPAIVGEFRGFATTLRDQQANFASADAVPTKNLPATTVPWAIGIAGGLLLLLGAGLALPSSRRWVAVSAVSVGVALVAGVVILELPKKANDVNQLVGAVEPFFTPEQVQGAEQALATVGAMATQLQSGMLPTLGRQLGLQPAQLQTVLARDYPALSGALSGLPQTSARFGGLVDTLRSNTTDYERAARPSLPLLVWLLLAGGIAAGFGGLVNLLRPRTAVGVAAEPAMAEVSVAADMPVVADVAALEAVDARTPVEEPTVKSRH